jgi:hypothetical protein
MFFSPIQGSKISGHLSDVACQDLLYVLYYVVGSEGDRLQCAHESQGYFGMLSYVLQGCSWE